MRFGLKSKRAGLVGLVTAVAMLVMAVGASAASAHEFTSTKETTLERVANQTQVFKLVPTGEEAVECKKDAIVKGGAVPGGSFQTVSVEIEYSECQAVHTLLGTVTATVSNADYTFDAEQYANLTNTVTINGGKGACVITVAPQNELGPVFYEPLASGNMLVDPQVEGIHWTASGIGCRAGKEGVKGTYTGTTEVHGPGSVLGWK